MPQRNDDRLLYPKEICEEFHEICKALNWNEQTLGYFVKGGLFPGGGHDSSKNRALIRVSSFLKLVDFVIEEMDDTVRLVRKHRPNDSSNDAKKSA